MPEATDQPVACPDCGSTNLKLVRVERGVKGEWNWWWLESWCCVDCQRKMIPKP